MAEIQNKSIVSRDTDFAEWYTSIVKKADLVDYSSMKGSMIIRPYGYAIWERMVAVLDKEFKRLGHEMFKLTDVHSRKSFEYRKRPRGRFCT